MKTINYELVQEVKDFNYLDEQLYYDLYELANEKNIITMVEKFHNLKKKKIDINRVDKNGQTALILATNNKNETMVDLLLQENANINLQDKEGNTALIMASKNELTSVAKKLLTQNADTEIENYVGQNAIYFALTNKDTDIMDLLEEHGTSLRRVVPLNVTDIEEEKAKKIVSVILDSLNTKSSIIEFLTYALNCNYSYELDLDYYINNNPNFLVSFKPGRDQQFHEYIVQLYKDIHEKHLNSLNINNQSKNNIRNKVYDLLMYKYQLGKYTNSQFIEPETSSPLIERLLINENSYKAELKIYDDYLMLYIKNKHTGDIAPYKYLKNNKKYENKDRGTIIVRPELILEYDKNEGSRQWSYEKISKVDGSHNPKALSSLLKKFSSDERLKYTNHSWDVDEFYEGNPLDYNTFMEYLNLGWDEEINTDLAKLSSNLHAKINSFLFSGDEEHIGFSSTQIKNALQQGNKPETIFPEDGKTFQDKMNDFKGLIVVKQNDKKLKLLKIFTELKKQLQLSIKLNLDDLKEDKIDKFFTDVDRLKKGLKIMLTDINENADANTKDVIVKAQEVDDVIEIKIIHKSSSSSKTAQQLSETINDNGGNFKTMYNNFRSVCDWSIDTMCQDENKDKKSRYQIDYLYPKIDNNKPHYRRIDDTIEGFTHILRFYK